MLASLFRQLDAFVKGGYREILALRRLGLGATYEERRQRYRIGIERAVQSSEFLSDLAEGLAGVNMYESDPTAPKKLVAAAARLDVFAAGGAHERGASRAPKRRRGGAA